MKFHKRLTDSVIFLTYIYKIHLKQTKEKPNLSNNIINKRSAATRKQLTKY